MDLLNTTPYVAAFPKTGVDEEHILAAVVVKGVFRIRSGRLVLDPERKWPAGAKPVPTPFGELDGDTPFLKDGMDLIILGSAYAPGDRPVRKATVTVRAGAFTYEALVIGDRTWATVDGALVPTRPEPFTSMPLTWERAFGGKAKVPPSEATSPMALEVPYAANPEGRGYCMDEAMAPGTLLPNLEDPAHPIASWRDRPEPVGVAPYKREWSLRALRGIEYDATSVPPRLLCIKPSLFNSANPRLVLKTALAPGESVRVSGVRPAGKELRFLLPDLAFHVYVQLGSRPYVFPAHLDTLIVLAEEKRVVLGFRCVFTYRVAPLEQRACVLREGGAPESVPPEYLVDWNVQGPRRIVARA